MIVEGFLVPAIKVKERLPFDHAAAQTFSPSFCGSFSGYRENHASVSPSGFFSRSSLLFGNPVDNVPSSEFSPEGSALSPLMKPYLSPPKRELLPVSSLLVETLFPQ